MSFPEVIERKRDGGATRPEELAAMIRGLLDDSIPPYQISAWLMAVVFRGMERAETAAFTRLMMESGDVLEHSIPKCDWVHWDPADFKEDGGVLSSGATDGDPELFDLARFAQRSPPRAYVSRR